VTLREYLPFGKPDFSDREIDAVTRVLRSGWVGMGPETIAFEGELAESLGVPHVVTVNSCTSALLISLRLSNVGPGDEVICPSLTWCSTANVALYLGAKPVFCDVDPDTLCITPDTVAKVLTARTRAVMAVHFGGLAIDIVSLRRALPPQVTIVEDAAHALGSRYPDGRLVGASGNFCCFSFYANKVLSTGEGGAVALFDAEKAEQIRSLRQHGLAVDAWKRFTHPRTILNADLTQLGYKANYTDLQASIGRVQLARQDEFSARRAEAAAIYREGLAGLPLAFQRNCTHPHHSRHMFVVVLEDGTRMDRDQLLVALRERNLGATIHYEPLHLMPLYNGGGDPPRLPNTERTAHNIITLPIGACIAPEDAREVVAAMHDLLG
jgi:perosamine synthetase